MRCLEIIVVLAIALGAISACAADRSNGREVYIFKGDDPALDGILAVLVLGTEPPGGDHQHAGCGNPPVRKSQEAFANVNGQ